MVVMDDDNCMVDVARYFIEFTHSESCGKCVPCRVGLDKGLRILNQFTQGKGTEEDLNTLDQLGRMIRDTSCAGWDRRRPTRCSPPCGIFTMSLKITCVRTDAAPASARIWRFPLVKTVARCT